jgi:hypothetical protein
MRKMLLTVAVAAIALTIVPSQARTDLKPGMRVLDLPMKLGRIASFGARESGNWAGYNLGYLGEGKRQLYKQVSGTWTVPTATKHNGNVDEYSVNWVGIGGGCVTKNCLAVDGTLIQAGTGQYIDSAGRSRYFAWWEIIPGPILEITNFAVRPGDRVFAEVKLAIPASEIWRITIQNQTTGQNFVTTVPYSSSFLTAEWIEERPSVGGLPAPLPNLTNPRFDNAVVNNAPVTLNSSSTVVMTNGSQTLATPSNPDAERNGFNVCTYATSCA